MIKILKEGVNTREEIFSVVEIKKDVSSSVKEILQSVKEDGDKALYYYTEKFDGAKLTNLRVSKEEIEEAVNSIEPEFLEILKEACENIKKFHSKQKREGFEINENNGIILGQKIIPVEVAGLYVPGGTAAYPSTVLMDAIPAKIAGVERVIITTPPNASGKINPAILASAFVAGVDEIYKVGGAQAIGAMAYGTESIPKTDKIVGPGNAFVAEAKRQVYGEVSIDMIAGPSEILVIADSTSNPSHVAADMLSQAEHDKLASAVLITDNEEFANNVALEIEKQIPNLKRNEIARASIDNNGKIIITNSIEKAIEISNKIAPEHLELCLDNAMEYLSKIKHAGSVFLGKNCPEALGDYFAGSNHTLPTSGTARFSSPLSVDDFIKKTQYIYYDKNSLNSVCKKVEYFALKEGLTAHAKSAVIRSEQIDE